MGLIFLSLCNVCRMTRQGQAQQTCWSQRPAAGPKHQEIMVASKLKNYTAHPGSDAARRAAAAAAASPPLLLCGGGCTLKYAPPSCCR